MASQLLTSSSTSCEVTHNQKINEDVQEDDLMEFAFDFSGHLGRPSISDADELFDAGKIKPLQPKKKSLSPVLPRPPPLQLPDQNTIELSTQKNFQQLPDKNIKVVRKNLVKNNVQQISDVISYDHEKILTNQSSLFGFTWYNKWNLKNLLLFRSTSEGSAATITKGDKDVKNASFRSTDGGSSVVGCSRRRKKRKVMSAHEIHYTANRAVTEKMRRKTHLPYKSGLFGCLGFGHNFHESSLRGR